MKKPEEQQCFLMSPCQLGHSGGYSCTWISFNIYLSIINFIWYPVRYIIRRTSTPPNVTRSTKLWGTQCFPDFAFRSTDLRVPENLIFPALLIRSMKFLYPEVALYLYKSTIWPCIEYCCHVWASAPSCYLELLDKLQKWICTTVGPSLAASLELLAHCWNIASLSLFYRYYFGRCSSELAQLVPRPYFRGRCTRYRQVH